MKEGEREKLMNDVLLSYFSLNYPLFLICGNILT